MEELQKSLSDFVVWSIGDQEYKFSKINLGTLADFSTMMANRMLRAGLDALGSNATPSDRAATIQMMKYNHFTEDMDLMQTTPGMQAMLYLTMKEYNPSITEKDAAKLIKLKDIIKLRELFGLLLDNDPDITDESENVDGESEQKNETVAVAGTP